MQKEEKIIYAKKRNRFKDNVFVVVIIALLATAIEIVLTKNSKISGLTEEASNLTSALEERDSLVNDMDQTLKEIENNLTFIRNRRGDLLLKANGKGQNTKEMIVSDIELMNKILEASESKLEKLNNQLTASKIEAISFRKKLAKIEKNGEKQDGRINELEIELAKRNSLIVELEKSVHDLKASISDKQDSLENTTKVLIEYEDELANKEKELNTVYFVTGTLSELIKNGIVEKEGGFLGIGRNETLNQDFDQNYFTQIDKRNTDIFPIFSKKAELITEHPDSSYRYIVEDNKIIYLKIDNPDEFWKVSKYAVVQLE